MTQGPPGSREEGQALVIIAIGLAVLFAALSFVIDWGYGLSQRRVMTNAAQSGALAAGKMLATSVVVASGQILFNRTQEAVYCEVKRFVAANRGFSVSGATYSLIVEYGDGASPPNWTTSSSAACPAVGGTAVPASARYVRVVSQVTYPSLVASTLGQPSLTAAASARTRLVGTPPTGRGPNWPMIRHYDPADFQGSSCGNPCNPDAVPPVSFWSTQGNEPNMVYGNFKGQTDFSRYSSRHYPSVVPSLLASWDQSGSAQASPTTPLKADRSGNCSGGLWDTAGGEAPQQQNKQCSIPNWFSYAFQGRLSLFSDWSAPTTGPEAPSPLGARPSVCPPSAYITAPSCGNDRLGDWVETTSGNLGQNNSDLMRQRIQAYGRITPFSDNQVKGAPAGTVYGKALVILVHLWDCAETYDGNAPAGSRWSLVPGADGDCTRVPQTGNTPTPDRLHLFSVAPFTFYEGLVDTSSIKGFWGGAFGDPDDCPSGTCELNPLSNAAFLVADQ